MIGPHHLLLTAMATAVLYAGLFAFLAVRLDGLKRRGNRFAPSLKEMGKSMGLKSFGHLFSGDHRYLSDGASTTLIYVCRLLLITMVVSAVMFFVVTITQSAPVT